MTAPQRPASVPEDARFVTDDDWFDNTDRQGWQLGETGPTGRTGRWRFWTPDGRLTDDVGFVDGELDGQCRSFHDDGTVAWDNVWERGRRRLVRQRRSANPTSQSVLGGIADTVQSSYQEYDDAGYQVTETLHDHEGRHVDAEGNPAPDRPAAVPATTSLLLVTRQPKRTVYRTGGASMVVTEQPAPGVPRWVAVRWDSGAGRFSGPRLAWDTDGVLVTVGYHDADGRLTSIDQDGDSESNPLLAAARQGDDAAVETLIAHGAGTSAHAAEHADFEGLHALAQRLRAADRPSAGITDPRQEPERPELVPADVPWVPGLDGWLRFGLDEGTPTGTWTWWENDDNPWLVEVELVDGRRAVRTKKLTNGRLSEQQVFAPDGAVRISREYDRGVVEKEREVLDDGAVAERRFYDDGTRQVERVTADGALVEERWWREDGTLAAVVSPSQQVVVGEALKGRNPGYTAFVARLTGEDTADQPVVGEWWRAFDAEGTPIAEGPVRPGLDGKAVEKWRLLDPDGTPRATVKIGKYKHRRSADLGEFAVEVARWRSMEQPAALAGVDDVKWKKLDSCYGFLDPKDYPRYLTAVAVPGGAVARWAFYELYGECLHQNTVYDVTGPVVRFLCRILADGVHRGTALERELLEFVADCASGSGSFWLAAQVRQIVTDLEGRPLRKAVKAAGDAGCYVEVYRSLAENLAAWQQIVLDGPTVPNKARWLALHLIAFAPGAEADQTLRDLVPVYEEAVQAGRDLWELAELLLCLGVAGTRPGVLDVLRAYLGDPRPLVRFAAARTWIRLAGDAAVEAVDTVLDALTSTELDAYRVCYLAEGSAATAAATALSELPPALADQAVNQVCAVLQDARASDAVTIARALLDVVFPRRGYDEGTPLTPGQRTAIRAIVDAPTAWTFNVDLHEVLRYNGLPEDRDELRALVG
ncbi:MAG: hypothetical protein FWH11_09670 [Micrococcales bacterium]|nr:hypothetical protein [Micrococcales bacterium]